MTVIWSNLGDNDTALLENIWKGIDGVKVVELNKETENIDEAVMEAILAEDDTLVLAGHGSPNGLYNPCFNGYAFSYPEVGFVKAKNVFCIWCHASAFCVENDFECLATSMFISNVGEAYMNSIYPDTETIDRCNLKFYAECNHCLKEGMSMRNMYSYLGSRIDLDNDVDRFNRSGLTLVENDSPDYRKRYERLGNRKWFNTHYDGKSLGEVTTILDDIVENQKSIPLECAQLVNDNFWDLVGHSSETDMYQSDVAKEKEKTMKKLTFEEVMARYEELVNDEYEFPSFSSYYVTDNDCDGTKEKPYKLKCLWLVPIAPYSKNENNRYVLSEEQKTNFKKILIETFNKENIYLL